MQTINVKGTLHSFERPWVMGILNITPDSFFSHSRCPKELPQAILEKAQQMLNDGADVLDIGAISTRPGASPISEREEIERLNAALRVIRPAFPEALISIDTYRSTVARFCVEQWDVNIINDISGGNLDKQMLKTVAQLGVPYVLMHMQGEPQTMQVAPHYEDIVSEVITHIAQGAQRFYEYGGKDVIADPGFGFGKSLQHNYTLFAHLSDFHELQLPLLVGISRKSMVYKPLEGTPETALNGTTALHAWALQQGAHILRVHDVRAAAEVLRLHQLLTTATGKHDSSY